MSKETFDNPAGVGMQGVQNIGDISKREGFHSSTEWAARFADALCKGDSLDILRERFAALVSVAGLLSPDNAAAEEIGRHYLILDSLWKKLVISSLDIGETGARGSSEAAERLMNGAFKAQRAALACLSALKVLRQSTQPQPPTTAKPGLGPLSMSGLSNC